MKRWMVILSFTQQIDLALLPAERAHVQELMAQKALETIYIASDNSKVWLVMHGEQSEDIEQSLTLFPLHKYFEAEIIGLNP